MPIATSSSDPPVNPARRLSCVVVEDQVLFLEMLSGLLDMRGGLRVVASARMVETGSAACARHRPDLLMLDLDLPDGSGLEVARVALECRPDARIIILSGHARAFVCPAWLNDNLQAVISKNDAFATLRAELDELLGSEEAPAFTKAKAGFASKTLTSREAEIFALIGDGHTSKEIGSRLNLSLHTIQAHRKRMAVKLGTTGSQLVQLAIRQRQLFFNPAALGRDGR